MNEHSAFIKRNIYLATKAALTGSYHQYRHGSILVKSGNALSVGVNNCKTHPMSGIKTMHSEVAALIGVRWSDLSGSIMFNSRVNKNGKVGASKPCPLCQDIMKAHGVRKVYYTTGSAIEELKLT